MSEISNKELKKDAVMKMIYGAINELSKDSHYYYEGYTASYNHITPTGEVQLLGLLEQLIPLVRLVEGHSLEEKAKQLTIDALSSPT